MNINFTPDDDPEVLKGLMAAAKQMRRKNDAKAASTAVKVELLFSKAIEQICSTQPESATSDTLQLEQ